MRKRLNIDISEYDYELPGQKIAKHPLQVRDQSLLLYYENRTIDHTKFHSLPDLLGSGDLLVFNDTRVIQARLQFYKISGAKIELFCLEPVEPADYQVAFEQRYSCRWRCLVGNAKKWKHEELCLNVISPSGNILLSARKIKQEVNSTIIEFYWDDHNISFAEIIETAGLTPIPPYLNRPSEYGDKESYQTVYCRYNGSVAAPTAGLHFTDSLLNRLNNKGIQMANLTLHVGAGTFVPVREHNAANHVMHSEFVQADREFIRKVRDHQGRVIAVGTTSLRSLESLYRLGIAAARSELDPMHIKLSQWEIYDSEGHLDRKESLGHLIAFMDRHEMSILQFHTKIMIVPGYQFRIVNGLVTNFHQPKSTLLLLIAAFIGDKWRDVYDYAMKNEFRFLSYGDGSILFP
ncbi:MAG TPA: S-adenosylmethionine:tRNA ribosyltransferase-isomerase [Bacteroidaceae bacterium]|mgnify:CR=1 FL=1|nr:S-adenosylmethionine:tRNA ribosyltransferase-isomerase [Bacteroidaceae bacterium]